MTNLYSTYETEKIRWRFPQDLERDKGTCSLRFRSVPKVSEHGDKRHL